MKIEFQSAVGAIEQMNSDLMVSTGFVSFETGHFLRAVQFGCSKDEAKRLHCGQKVRITIEVLDE